VISDKSNNVSEELEKHRPNMHVQISFTFEAIR
jgi:hypothetical protein